MYTLYEKLVNHLLTAEQESMTTRDHHNPTEPPPDDDDVMEHSTKNTRDHFNTDAASISRLQQQARLYFTSFPDPDNVPDNTGAHTLLKALLAGTLSPTPRNLTLVDNILSYRMQLSSLATALLAAAGIPRPEGKSRFEFNVDKFETQVKKTFSPLRKAYQTAVGLCYSNVLPRPDREYQGRPWNRPHRYIAAGCAYAATSGESDAPTVEEAVGLVERAYEDKFRACWHGVQRESLPLGEEEGCVE